MEDYGFSLNSQIVKRIIYDLMDRLECKSKDSNTLSQCDETTRNPKQ